MNRRTHLKTLLSAGALAASPWLHSAFAAEGSSGASAAKTGSGWKPGAQLFTLRELLKKDPRGTLQALAKIGFTEIEPFGMGGQSTFATDPLFGLKLPEFKKVLQDLGLKVPTCHFAGGDASAVPAAAEIALALGAHTLIHPMAREFQTRDKDGLLVIAPAIKDEAQLQRLAQLFNQMGEACKRAGIGFAYHNHHTEFSMLGGKNAYDLLLAQTDASLVKMELDIGWAKVAGVDGADYLDRYPQRFVSCHLKDFNPKLPAKFSAASPIPEMTQLVPPGEGIIDFPKVLAAVRRAGVRHGYVEVDIPQGDPLDVVRRGYRYLTSLDVARA